MEIVAKSRSAAVLKKYLRLRTLPMSFWRPAEEVLSTLHVTLNALAASSRKIFREALTLSQVSGKENVSDMVLKTSRRP
jgi:hypothetical protein